MLIIEEFLYIYDATEATVQIYLLLKTEFKYNHTNAIMIASLVLCFLWQLVYFNCMKVVSWLCYHNKHEKSDTYHSQGYILTKSIAILM